MMRRDMKWFVSVIPVLMVLLVPGTAAAQFDIFGEIGKRNAKPAGPPPRTEDGKPDMRGLWFPTGFTSSMILEEHPGGFGLTAGKSAVIDPPDGKLPYQPWALAERDRRSQAENAYEDPQAQCLLTGVPRVFLFNFEVAYIPNHLVFAFEYNHITRVIPMDGRPHLPEGIRLAMGDPRGHWEGDTLVIDTTNFDGSTWLAGGGDFATEQAHVTERFTMPNSDLLIYEATVDDRKAYTRPFTLRFMFVRIPEGEMLDEACHEGNVALAHAKKVYDDARGVTPK